MKRILFISILAALLCGCIPAGNGGQGSTTDSVCIDTADSFVQDEPEPEPEPVPEPPFTSPDLKTFRLQGHVKQVVERIGNYTEIYKFDKQGKLLPDKIKPGQSGITQIERNKAGQIYTRDWTIDEYMWHFYMYKYNKDGYVQGELFCTEVEEYLYENKYTLNENGWIVSAKRKTIIAEDFKFDYYEGEEVIERYTDNYSYPVTDEQGNWLKCTVKCREDGKKYITTRKITYWQ